MPDRLGIETTFIEIISRTSARGRRQTSLVKGRSSLQHPEQGFLLLRAFAFLRGRARDGEPSLARQFLDRLDEIEIVVAHDEPDRIAMRTTAKAVKKRFVLDNVEGGRLFVVEGAQPGIFAATPDKLHAAADQAGKRNPAAQLVKEAGLKGHLLYPLQPGAAVPAHLVRPKARTRSCHGGAPPKRELASTRGRGLMRTRRR